MPKYNTVEKDFTSLQNSVNLEMTHGVHTSEGVWRSVLWPWQLHAFFYLKVQNMTRVAEVPEKECFKCHSVKPLTEFYAHPQMADGHVNKCKECNKRDVSQNYGVRRGQYALYEQNRAQRPERKVKQLEYLRSRRKNRPEKYRAYLDVANALKRGDLEKRACEVCGCESVEGHHEDYSKPLDVRWLCREHHKEVHGKVPYKWVMPGRLPDRTVEMVDDVENKTPF